MARYVALIRGVNVGGRNKLPMADLRAGLEAAAFSEVRTHVQSGNVVFDTDSSRSETTLAGEISAVIESMAGLDVPVVVRSASDLEAVHSAGHPMSHLGIEDNLLMVGFCSHEPTSKLGIDADRYEPDRAELVGAEVFLAYPEGSARSKLTIDVLERDLGVTLTARNWRTVSKVAAMLED